MLKAAEQNDKLKRAIILSIVLHCVLIAILIWGSIHQPQESSAAGSGGSSIDAVMVDPGAGAIVQQFNRQQQRDKQAQQRLKALEKQRLAAQAAAEAQQRDHAEQQKQAQEAVKQAQAQQRRAKADAVAQQQMKAKKAAAADAKAKVDQAAKYKTAAQADKQSSDVDALLGGLTEARSAPKAGGVPAAGAWRAKQSGASIEEIDAYKAQVSRAISDKFYDSSSYSGRTCDLHIKLAPDGLLISVAAVGGDPALCQAAVSAAKLATIPRPSSPQVYEMCKNATLGFSPQ